MEPDRPPKFAVTARIAAGTEREELWRACNEMYGGFDKYLARLKRTPSVWVLEPLGAGGPEREEGDVGTTKEPAAAQGDIGPLDII